MPTARIEYEPAKSRSATPRRELQLARTGVALPVNYLIIRALLQYDRFSGPDFTIEYLTRPGRQLTPPGDRRGGDLTDRLTPSGSPDPTAGDPSTAAATGCNTDPGGRDTCFVTSTSTATTAPLAAMHQTGWTALVADLILDPPGQSHTG